MTNITNIKSLAMYNTIIRWSEHYGTSRIFGGTLTDSKQIYASHQMSFHYVNLAQRIHGIIKDF